MIDFVFKEKIEKDIAKGRLKILEDNSLTFIKGLALNDNTILINLSALQWKSIAESVIITEMGKTITHENIHVLLNQYGIPMETQEKFCRIMACQDED